MHNKKLGKKDTLRERTKKKKKPTTNLLHQGHHDAIKLEQNLKKTLQSLRTQIMIIKPVGKTNHHYFLNRSGPCNSQLSKAYSNYICLRKI